MLNRLLIYITNMSLKRKILAIIIFVNIFLVGTISILGINLVINANNKILYQSIASGLSYSGADIEDVLDNALTLSNIMISDDVIQQQLISAQENDRSQVRSIVYKKLYTTNQSYYFEFKKDHIGFISIYNDYFSVNTYIPPNKLLPDDIENELIQSAIEKDGAPYWSTDYIIEYGLFLAREVRKIENLSLEKLGVILINIDLEKIVSESTRFSNQYENSYFMLFDKDHLIYRSEFLADQHEKQVMKEMTEDYNIIKIDGKKYFAVKGFLPEMNWDYICLVSYDKTSRTIFLSYLLYLFIIFVSVILSIFLSGKLIKLIIKHFDNLIYKMRSFRGQVTQRINVGYDYSQRQDEFGILHRQFDSMATEIQDLIQVNYVNELLVRDAKFKALETQMNPHFLYNILESVNWRAKAIGESKISEMVESLGMLLRSTLSEHDDNFTLKKEMELVECYLTIQKIRFDDQLECTLDIDEAYLDAKIPKLVLQPMVENAIHYGLEEITDVCLISIHSCVEDEKLMIKVKNSGTQFEDNLLIKLANNEITPHGMGIGLQNINDRLKITYGEDYGLEFYNETNTAVVKMTIPYQPI